ncbi:HDOD domain-containing protein [Candidatus Latescibacterota bacterium]
MKKTDLSELVQEVNKSDISSIKQIIIPLIQVINDPKSSAVELQDIIVKDPPLSAKLLKISNSAYYGFRRKISKILEAIVCIGFDKVKELALRQKVCELFKNCESFKGFSRVALWEHSLAVALCGKYIYMREFKEQGEIIYSAGLLQNIGIIIEDQFLQKDFESILTDAYNEDKNLYELERNRLGFDHADIGRAVSDNWNFPDELVLAIANHHNPVASENGYKRIIMTSFIADYICQRYELGYCDAPYKNEALYLKCLDELSIEKEAMELIIEDVQEEISKLKEYGWFQNEIN